MTLIAALAHPPKSKTLRCGTGDWIKSRPDAERVEIESALSDTRWKTQDLLDTLRVEAEFPLKYNALRLHRAGGCSCVAE